MLMTETFSYHSPQSISINRAFYMSLADNNADTGIAKHIVTG